MCLQVPQGLIRPKYWFLLFINDIVEVLYANETSAVVFRADLAQIRVCENVLLVDVYGFSIIDFPINT